MIFEHETPDQILAEMAELGITKDEINAELEKLNAMPPAWIPGFGPVSGLAAAMLTSGGGLLRAPQDRSSCYRIRAGMVHVQPGCRCKGRRRW